MPPNASSSTTTSNRPTSSQSRRNNKTTTRKPSQLRSGTASTSTTSRSGQSSSTSGSMPRKSNQRSNATAAGQGGTGVRAFRNMNKSKKGGSGGGNKNDPWASMEADLATQGSSENRFQLELTKARKSGQLQLKECGLRCPLPDDMFCLRSGAASDGVKSWECHGEETLISLDLSESDLSGCVDADGDGEGAIDVYAPLPKKSGSATTNGNGTNKPKDRPRSARSKPRASPSKSTTKPKSPSNKSKTPPVRIHIPGMLDERIGRFVSLRTLRIKRCKLTKLPWTIIQQQLTSLVILDASDNNMASFQLESMPPSLSTLDISRNMIEQLTLAEKDQENVQLGQFIDLPNLTHFDANCNKITALPALRMHAPILQHLFLSQNKLTSLAAHSISSSPSLLESCRDSLQTLYAPENDLAECPDLDRHSRLTVVELRMNRLTSPPAIHGNLVRLQLNNNRITSLENLYPILKDRPSSQISDGDDAAAPPGGLVEKGYYRTKMKEIHLQSNDLSGQTALDPKVLEAMTQLTVLDVSHNDLDTIPSILGYLPDLRSVLLHGNPLRMIRHAIKFIDSDANKNNAIQTGGGRIDTTQLKTSMRLKGSPPSGPGYLSPETDGGSSTTVVRETEGTNYAMELVHNATIGEKKLNMSQGNYPGKLTAPDILRELNKTVTGMEESTISAGMGASVAQWDVSSAKVVQIGPEWMEAMENLTLLDVHQNFLASFPENVHKLPLKTLFAGSNLLGSKDLHRMIVPVPSSDVGGGCSNRLVENLQYLDLSANKLEWVPGGLFELESLRSLNLSHNKIKDLIWQPHDRNNGSKATAGGGDKEDEPISSGWKHGLVELIQLDLSNNQIDDLGYMPMALSGCKSLRTLHLNNNNLDDIPLELGLLKQLTTITLGGNPQKGLRQTVLTQSCEHILTYLHDKMDPDEIRRVEEQHHAIDLALTSGGLSDERDRCTQLEESVRELKLKIDDGNAQLEKISISAAKRAGLKKDLAIQRAKLNREEKLLMAGAE